MVVGEDSDDVVASSLGASPETTSPDAGSITVVPLSDDSVKISWSSSSEAQSYQVHDSNGLVATIQHPATSYTAEGLLPNTEYTYRIRVCDSSGCSDWTSESIKISLPQAISNANELAAIGLDNASLAGDYTLTDNINLSSIPNWLPIGNITDAFTGTFNGNGYNISGISISDYKHAGLFGYVKDAHISNLVVLVDSIKALAYSRGSSATAGGLAGYAYNSEIINSYVVVSGNISSYSSYYYAYTGGLVGWVSSSKIINSYAVVLGDISSSSRYTYAGGLVGYASNNEIINSYAVVSGNIYSSSSRDSYAGGLIGWARSSPIINSYAVVAGDISASSTRSSKYRKSNAGGLVGLADRSPIRNSYAVVAGDISAISFHYTYSGGLVGLADRSPIRNSYAVVSGSIFSIPSAVNYYAASYAGGLVGLADRSPISNSYVVVVGDVSHPSSYSYTGGLVGDISDSQINNSYYNIGDEYAEWRFDNSFGDFKTLDELRALTADATSWDEVIWNFGTDVDLPTLFSNVEIVKISLPTLPTPIVTATAHGAYSIKISWKRVRVLPQYKPYYEVHNKSGLVAKVSRFGNSYTFNGLSPTTEYDYSVRVCDSSSCSDFARISATTRDVRTINNAIELAAISDNLTTLADDYVLTTNIDLSAISNWHPIGDSIDNEFTGSFDGDGYNISGVTILGYEFAGLFGNVDGASISNLGVVIGNISSATYAGGIAGRIGGGSWISNSYAVIMGNVHAEAYAGGLVGLASSSPISSSYAVVAGNISSDGTSGGLVGWVVRSPISNSHAIVGGDISSAFASGGLAGVTDYSPIVNSYALVTGDIYSSSHSGGLVARSYKSPISRSYAVVGGDIFSNAPNVDGAYAYAGGLAGYAGSNNFINDSYAIVSGAIYSYSFLYSYAAGLIGNVGTNTPISSSYALVEGAISSASAVPAEAYAGGLTARDVSNNLFNKCYYSAIRESSEGNFNNIYGVYKKVDELRILNAATSNWDETIWDFGTDADLPTLFPFPAL